MSVKLQQYFIKILGIKNNNNKFLVLINHLQPNIEKLISVKIFAKLQ